MTPQQRAELIARYQDGYNQIVDALEGITTAELDFRPAPTQWSAREIVHHLADSETISGIRLRQLLAEKKPQIQAYDQDEFARFLHYSERSLAPSLAAFKAARETTAQLFEFMTEADWQRTGVHSESGAYSAETWLQIYATHAQNHADQIRRNRKLYREHLSLSS
ncbi:MAG: DinB family protein [candidate division KSB1 bacterium]|nr:DinB family protein [candidate division KSB1 bacterium]MDZ7301549.1 DinB family protein [candidate division KSB1 bacterium]MDZ7311035.1 DinB family protein [candidate division KSB1 bacterium]